MDIHLVEGFCERVRYRSHALWKNLHNVRTQGRSIYSIHFEPFWNIAWSVKENCKITWPLMVHLSSRSGNIMQFRNYLWESSFIFDSKWLHMPIQSRQCWTLFFVSLTTNELCFWSFEQKLIVMTLNCVVAHFETTIGLIIESLT